MPNEMDEIRLAHEKPQGT